MTKYRRRPAAAYLSEKLGANISDRTLEVLPIPYKVIARKALYDKADLDAYAEAELTSVPVRVKGRPAA